MKNNLKHIISVVLISICSSCGGSDDNPAEPSTPVAIPAAALLIFPDNNTECNEGKILSETESEVIFRWNNSEDTDSYTVNLKNLNSGNVSNFDTNLNETPIAILRGVPYEWSVTSKANGTTESTESEIWRFYNAGLATESHVPFPADVAFPQMGSAVNSGIINLKWTTEDIDNDLVSFKILLDTNSTPTTIIDEVTTTNLNVEVLTNTIYYWQVIAVDATGNTSTSQIFEFKVN